MPTLHTIDEAARILDVPPRVVRQWVTSDPPLYFSPVSKGGELMIPATDLRRHLGRAVRPVYSIATTARLFDVSPWTVRNWIKSGRFRPVQLFGSGHPRIPEEQIVDALRHPAA